MEDWKKTVIKAAHSVREAIGVIDSSGLQIALVLDEDGRLVGTVTDGDVRRAILRGVSLDDSVTQVMNERPTTARVQEGNREKLLARMRERRIHQIPMLDEAQRVVGLEVLDDLLRTERRPNAVVLMAGGLGTRLRPLTDDCPKPLLKVGPKPILETILESFVEYGFHRFYLSVNYRAEMIEDYFGDGGEWDVEIEYLREEERRGTAGALSLLPERPDAPFFVMNGDLLTQLDFGQLLDFHTNQEAVATMCVREYEMQVPYGVVEVEGHRILGLHEKPTERYLVNAGIYVLDPGTLEAIPKSTFFDMTDLFEHVLKHDRKASVFPVREYWMDIGQKEDFRRANGQFEQVFETR